MHVDVRKWWFFVSNHPFNHLHFWSWQNEFALIAQKGWTSIQPCFIVSSFLTTLSVIAFIEFTPSPSAAGALWAIVFGIRQENHVHDDDEEQENIYQNWETYAAVSEYLVLGPLFVVHVLKYFFFVIPKSLWNPLLYYSLTVASRQNKCIGQMSTSPALNLMIPWYFWH